MAQHDRNMAVPKNEEIVSLACVECLTHLLDRGTRVLRKAFLKLSGHKLSDFFVHQVRSALESLFLQIF